MHDTNHALQLASDMLTQATARLALATDNQQARFTLQLLQALQQIAMPLLGFRCAHTFTHGSIFRGGKHDPPLFKGQLAALFIQGSKLIE